MSAREIVLVLPDPPLPFGNAAGRWYYALLKGLSRRGHRVSAFAVCSSEYDRNKTEELFRSGESDLRLYTQAKSEGMSGKLESLRRPYSYRYSAELMHEVAARVAAGCDVVHLEQLWTGWVGWEFADRALLNIHYLFEIDLADAPVASLKDGLLRRATRRAERRLLRHYPVISTLTPRLSDRVTALAPRARVETVPLGLDLSPYRFEDREPHDPPTVALIGSFDWYPTLSGARRLLDHLWPGIKRRVPDARLLLVGRSARSQLERYLDLPDVEIYENVPDILPYFEATDVMLYAPARGSGMKVKVLESFALGIPVVTTSEGVEGIAAEDGVHAGVADDDDGLVERAVGLLQDRDAWQAMRSAARPLVERACDPEQSLDLVERCYESIGSQR